MQPSSNRQISTQIKFLEELKSSLDGSSESKQNILILMKKINIEDYNTPALEKIIALAKEESSDYLLMTKLIKETLENLTASLGYMKKPPSDTSPSPNVFL